MLYKGKMINSLKFSSKYILNAYKLSVVYYSEKKVNAEDFKIKKKPDLRRVPTKCEEKALDPHNNILELCENKSQVLQAVATEKAKEAAAHSKLSKECKELSDRTIALCPSGLQLRHLDTDLKQLPPLDKRPSDEKEKIILGGSSDGTPPGTIGSSSTVQRIIRQDPGKVHLGFIPVEWFQFFIPRTGVTGFYTFLVTFGTYLVSKEHYVLEHNYYNGLSMIVIVWAAIKYIGPIMSRILDKEIDNLEKTWNQHRINQKNVLKQNIYDEEFLQFQAEGQLLLLEAKRENVALQLEDEFRKRQMTVYEEVLNRLEYQVEIMKVHRKISQKNLIAYVVKEVNKSITPELQKQILDISIDSIIRELEKSEKP